MANDVGIEIFIDSVGAVKGADKVKDGLSKVKAEADKTAKEVEELKSGLSKLSESKGVKKTGDEFKGLKNESLKAKKEIGELNKKINSLNKSDGAKNVRTSIKKVKEEALGADKAIDRLKQGVVALFAFGTAKKALETADSFNVLQQRIKTATKATGDFKSVSEDLFKVSQKNGTALETNVELFQGLARVAPELNATNSQMLKLTETVGQLGVIGGSSTEAMKNGLLQFTQGLAAGTFRAEEFNSILENLPEVAVRIANGMGVTVGELRKMVIEGKLLSKDVFNSLLNQSEGIAGEFAEMPLTLGRSVESFKNSLQKALGTLDQEINATNSLAKAIQAAGMALEGLAEHSETFITIGQVVATLIGARIAGALVIKTRATIADTVAMIANAKSTSAATVSVNAYTGAITRTAGASTAATVAAKGLKAALAFLGGPAGIAVLAAGAIYSFATSGDEASESSDNLKKRVDSLTKSFANLQKTQIETEISNIELEMRKVATTINEIVAADLMNSPNSPLGMTATYQIEQQKEKLVEYNGHLEALRQKLTEINEVKNLQPQEGGATVQEGDFVGPMPLSDQEQRRADDIAKLEEALKTEEELIQESYERRKETVQMGLVYNDQSQAWYDKRLTAWYTKQQKDLLKKQKAEQKAAYIHFQRKKLGEITYYKDHAQTLKFFNTWEVKTEQEKARFLMDTSMGLLSEMGQHSKTAFKVSKAFNLADATVQGLGAVQKALNSGPYPWNIGAAALVAAKTAVQIKGIKSQQFSGGGSAPSFSGGGGSLPSLPSLPDFESALPDFGEGLKTSAVESVAANDPIQTTEAVEPKREITVNINLEETIDKIDPEAQLSGTYVRTLLGRIQEEIENGVNINLLGDVA